ncbi:MAG: 1-acyl-sn-glycerol-3-phosphate acyltransferase [Bacteroidales bacterium]|nr:1-acyl-sn-glycerol-3-phosphate acyltransferase [Bacteroidales bacterium]
MNNQIFQIDIESVIKSKNPKLAKTLPKFVINFLKRLIHQEEINQIIKKYHDKTSYDFNRAILNEFKINYKVYGLEKIDKKGRYIFSANHPQGALESLGLIDIVYKNFGECRFVVNDVLLNLKNFHPLFIPVNAYGFQSKQSLKVFDEAFSSNMQILYYPAGLVSRKIKGQIKDLPWKKTFITLAKKYKRDVVPVYIEAKNTNFFYNFAKLRKLIGIKFNIELFLLPNEMFKQKNKTFTYLFGTPISYEAFTSDKPNEYWANLVYNIVYELKKQVSYETNNTSG